MCPGTQFGSEYHVSSPPRISSGYASPSITSSASRSAQRTAPAPNSGPRPRGGKQLRRLRPSRLRFHRQDRKLQDGPEELMREIEGSWTYVIVEDIFRVNHQVVDLGWVDFD